MSSTHSLSFQVVRSFIRWVWDSVNQSLCNCLPLSTYHIRHFCSSEFVLCELCFAIKLIVEMQIWLFFLSRVFSMHFFEMKLYSFYLLIYHHLCQPSVLSFDFNPYISSPLLQCLHFFLSYFQWTLSTFCLNNMSKTSSGFWHVIWFANFRSLGGWVRNRKQ